MDPDQADATGIGQQSQFGGTVFHTQQVTGFEVEIPAGYCQAPSGDEDQTRPFFQGILRASAGVVCCQRIKSPPTGGPLPG